MQILPVLDIKSRQVVHALAGRRDTYRPVVSLLTSSCHPLDVARAFREHFGLAELYVADLDALAGQPPNLALLAELRREGFRLWLDAGVRDVDQATVLAQAGIERIVLGLETVQDPEVVAKCCRVLPSAQLVFSLDLKDGTPLGNRAAWDQAGADDIAARVIAFGVSTMIVLDLGRVGTGAGTGTEHLCRAWSERYPALELVAGGGVSCLADLHRLAAGGVKAALVASALHDGRLTIRDVHSL